MVLEENCEICPNLFGAPMKIISYPHYVHIGALKLEWQSLANFPLNPTFDGVFLAYI